MSGAAEVNEKETMDRMKGSLFVMWPILRGLVPKVHCDYSFWNSETSSVDQSLFDVHFWWRWCRILGLDDFNVAVVVLAVFRDLNRGHVVLRDTLLGML